MTSPWTPQVSRVLSFSTGGVCDSSHMDSQCFFVFCVTRSLKLVLCCFCLCVSVSLCFLFFLFACTVWLSSSCCSRSYLAQQYLTRWYDEALLAYVL